MAADSSITSMSTRKKDIRRTSILTLGVGAIGSVAAIALASPLVLGATVLATGAWLGRLWVVNRHA